MAKGTLLTNFVDDILNASMNGKRRYNLIPNDDGTYSLEDVTTYDQIGSDFGSAIVNAICNAVNESVDKNKILETLDEVVATTEKGYIPDALALKKVDDSLQTKTSLKITRIHKVTESLTGNTSHTIDLNDVFTDLEYTTIYAIITTGIVPSSDWSTRLQPASIDYTNRLYTCRCIGSTEQTYRLIFTVLYV